jgi:hypothetical protein
MHLVPLAPRATGGYMSSSQRSIATSTPLFLSAQARVIIQVP